MSRLALAAEFEDRVLRANDVLLTMGAGSIGAVAASLPQTLTHAGRHA